MPSTADRRRYGTVFDEVAGAYDRHRPTYPDSLIDQACEAGRTARGDQVLEIGCGTGQLTSSLLDRGLRVTAVEPGRQLIARARERLADAGEAQFINTRFEDASLPAAQFRAVFCASAIHWIDPDVSWRRAADALVDGGTLALISYFGLEELRDGDDQRAIRAAIARIAPEIAVDWPSLRDLEETTAGATDRRANVSEVWAWLGSYEVARGYAARLFDEANLATVSILHEQTAEQLAALLGTMSFWARLSSTQRGELIADFDALYDRLARPIRSSTLGCLVTARRVRRA